MRAFEHAINVIQNNVSNVSTAGYARQLQLLSAARVDLSLGIPGGVLAGEVLSSRDQHAEQMVRAQQQSLGQAEERTAQLEQLEPIFDITEQSGIAGDLTQLFQSFSQLSIAPNNAPARQVVLDRAQQLSRSINQSANSLGVASANTGLQIRSTVASVNSLIGQLREYNRERRQNFESNQDPGLDAEIHNTLEKLSELVDFTALEQPDGTTTILLGGQTLALIGDAQFTISAGLTGSQASILDSQGNDITGQLSGGRLAGQLEIQNRAIPSYRNALDRLAVGIADTINSQLALGLDAAGTAPTRNLFVYDSAGGAAATLSTNSLTTGEIAAASSGSPGGNGNSLQLATLGSSKQIGGFTFTEFYGNLAGSVGRDLTTARNDRRAGGALLLQAKHLRAERSEVSLDEEAARLLQFQKSYEAAAKMVNVLAEITDSVMTLIR